MPQNTIWRGSYAAMALLLSINLFNYIDRQVLSAVVPHIKQELLSTPDQSGPLAYLVNLLSGVLGSNPENAMVGLLAMAFMVSYMIFAPLLSALPIKRWWIIAAGVVVWSLASGASGLAVTFGALLLTRIAVGIGEAAYGPVAPALLSDMFPVEKRGQILSWFYLAIPVGSALGFILGGYLSAHFGWRYAFYAVVPPGVLLGLLCLFLRDPAATPSSKAPEEPKEGKLRAYRRFLANRSYRYNTLAMTAMTFAIGGMAFWIPTYFHEFRNAGSLESINLIFGIILVLSGLTGTLAGGMLADKLRGKLRGSYLRVSGYAMLVAFPLSLGMLYAPFPLAWVFTFLACFCLFFNTGPSNTALANVIDPKSRASAFALNILIIHLLGDVFSPLVIGAITDATGKNMTYAFMVVSLMVLVGGILWIIGSRYLDEDTAKVSEK